MNTLKTLTDIKSYILAGKCSFALKIDGTYYGYTIQQTTNPCIFNVYHIDRHNSTYWIGVFFKGCNMLDVQCQLRFSSYVEHIETFFRLLYQFNDDSLSFEQACDKYGVPYEFVMSNKCARCGKILSTKDSILKGYGKCCEKKVRHDR